MKNKQLFTAITAIIIAIAGYLYFYPTDKAESLKYYENSEYGFSFGYPNDYLLETVEQAGGERRLTSIFIVADTEENRLVLSGQSPGREGPTSVSLDIYQNDLDNLSVEDWIKNTSASNYKLGDGNLKAAKIAGLDAINYQWDGLYQGTTSVFGYGGNIYALTATYLDSNDPTLKALETVASTIKFSR